MKNENKTLHGLIYGSWMIRSNLWVLSNGWQNFQYLLVGKEKAVLIDTGYGEGNIRSVVEEITSLPVMVINTHGHFDHTGGNGLWQQAWMGEASTKDCKNAFSLEQSEMAASKPYPNYETQVLTDGATIELGNETLEVMTIPAHHDGSIAILAHKNRLLFTGDELESGQVLILKQRSDLDFLPAIARHLANTERLLARQTDFDYLFPAHNGYMLDPDRYLNDFINLDQQILNGVAEVRPDTAGFNYPADPVISGSVFGNFGRQKRVFYGAASIVYLDGESGISAKETLREG